MHGADSTEIDRYAIDHLGRNLKDKLNAIGRCLKEDNEFTHNAYSLMFELFTSRYPEANGEHITITMGRLRSLDYPVKK